MKVFHIIGSLNVGGAEAMLARLVESDPTVAAESVVVSLTSLGAFGESLRARNVRVHTLGMTTFLQSPLVLIRLIRLIHQYQPEIVQTWMYHSDLIGGLAARLAGNCRVVWNVRSTAIPQGTWSMTYWLIRLCSICSYFIPDRIICCANAALASHTKLRYAKNKLIVIPNGYEFSSLQHSAVVREHVRSELRLGDRDILVGAIGRFDPLKDFHNFVAAAARLVDRCPNAKFLLVGRGNDNSNTMLVDWIESAGLADRFTLVGEQADVTRFLSAMDVFCLSSVSEAFPNVVVEAMALGLPCVVTHAGDAADILGDESFVVPTKDSDALANAMLQICNLSPEDRKLIGRGNAIKVRERYGIEQTRKRYEAVYLEVTQNERSSIQ